jgi:hypothetical protein
LIRSVEDVTAPPKDSEGNELDKSVEPRTDRVASGVDSFEVRMGYWFEGEWLLAEDWDSRLNTYRNPVDEEDGAQLNVDELAASSQGVGNTLQQELQQRGLQFIPDNIPAWVEVTIRFQSQAEGGKVTIYRNVVQMTAAQETNFDQELQRGTPGQSGRSRRLNP